jgi:pilus assembly protein CpaF
MLDRRLLSFFSYLLKHQKSLVIAGPTSSGKTELQKYLLTLLEPHSRVIVIDNILELDQAHYSDELDINIWQVDEKNNKASMNELIKNALRSNPDWLIVAESRGEEMLHVLNSVMTGNPIITTLHAENSSNIIPRMISMIMMNDKKFNPDDIKKDISNHLHYYVYLKRDFTKDGTIRRYVSEILFVNGDEERLIFESNKGFIHENMDEELSRLIKMEENK